MTEETPSPQEASAAFNPFEEWPDGKVSWRLRVALFFGGTLGITLLVIAFLLSPSPEGLGTHQQLGFPQCSFIELFEIPCPSCGMTTSWSHLTKGNVFQSFRSNVGGALLGIAAIICSPWFLVSGILGRWWIRPPDMVAGFYILLGITIVTVVQWIVWVTWFPL